MRKLFRYRQRTAIGKIPAAAVAVNTASPSLSSVNIRTGEARVYRGLIYTFSEFLHIIVVQRVITLVV